ncbi:hypothetical protein C3L33_03593, partial [Rhododendron williamsianum]
MYRTSASRLKALKGHAGNRLLTRFASSSAVATKSSSSGGFFSWLTGGRSSSLPPLQVPLQGVTLPPPLPDHVETESLAGCEGSGSYRWQCDSLSFEGAIGYTYDALKTYVPQMVELLIDCARNPVFLDWEINEQLLKVKAEITEASNNPSSLLVEAIHSVGYSGALANSLLASESAIGRLDSSILEEFVAGNYTAPRMVLAASGVEHDELLKFAEPLLSDIPSVPRPEEPKSVYVGGDYRCQADSGDRLVPRLTFLLLYGQKTHFALAFEAPGGLIKEKEAMILTVLQILMGGGGSFSVGGPGKGMLSRLYRRVLNQYPQIHAFTAFNTSYTNTGLFGIEAATGSDFVLKAIDIAVTELIAVATPGEVDQVELDRAKQSTKSAILMNLESRMVASEDIGRQIFTLGNRKPVEHFLKIVDEVSLKDIASIAKKLISSPLTMASHGDIVRVPS